MPSGKIKKEKKKYIYLLLHKEEYRLQPQALASSPNGRLNHFKVGDGNQETERLTHKTCLF